LSRVAVIQSNYLPWKGYFDIIHDVDLFIFYDQVQFTKNDWRNRNKIKVPGGTSWLSIPVGSGIDRLICDVELPDRRWAVKHWRSLQQYYSKAPHFGRYREFFEHVYLEREWATLSELNQFLIRRIARDFLGVTTEFRDAAGFSLQGDRQERLLDLLQQAGARSYLSGPAARGYIDEQAFTRAGIDLHYQDYAGYPEYEQFFPPFDHCVTVLDLLFHVGPRAPWYIWGWRGDGGRG